MVVFFKRTGDIPIRAEGKFSDSFDVKFPAKVIRDADSPGGYKAEATIKGFRFDQTGSPPQVFDVYAMQVAIADVVGDTVRLGLSCEARGKNVAKWEGHINVLVIADIESPASGTGASGST